MTIHMTKTVGIALMIGAIVASGWAVAASTAREMIETRQKNLKSLGGAFKAVRDEIRKSEPDAAQLKKSTAEIETLAAQAHAWFPKGSGPETKLETDAKPEIWTDPRGFETALKNFQAEAPKLAQFANANDIAGIKAGVGKLGGTCKGCHDKYRVPRD